MIQNGLRKCEALYGKPIDEFLTGIYLEGLADLPRPDVLEAAFDYFITKSKFFPTVASIREAYEIISEKRFAFGAAHRHEEVKTEDPGISGRRVTAWIYPDDPKPEVHYRALDCPEGREFLKALQAYGKGKPSKPPFWEGKRWEFGKGWVEKKL